jgi:hypothetical protein
MVVRSRCVGLAWLRHSRHGRKTQLDLSWFGLLSSMSSSIVIFMLGCPIRCYHGRNRERLETRARLCRAFPSDWASGNKNIAVMMRNSAIFSFYDFYVFSRLCHREGIILFIYYFGYWNGTIISFLLYLSWRKKGLNYLLTSEEHKLAEGWCNCEMSIIRPRIMKFANT